MIKVNLSWIGSQIFRKRVQALAQNLAENVEEFERAFNEELERFAKEGVDRSANCPWCGQPGHFWIERRK